MICLHQSASASSSPFLLVAKSIAPLRNTDFDPLNITDLYRLATAVLFPSETEGRGLPIIESAAIGVPIISSRYSPEEVFDSVIGEHLPEEQRIKYIHFPEGEFSTRFP